MSKRIRYFDISRGIAICLAVLGHCFIARTRTTPGFSLSAYNAVYFFHMALFFFLSGALQGEGKKCVSFEGSVKVILKRAVALLLPYLTFNLIGLPFYCLKHHCGAGRLVFGIICGTWNAFSHLWFLYVMFWVSVITVLVPRTWHKLLAAASALVFVFVSLSPELPPVLLYLSRYLCMYLLGEFCSERKQIIGVSGQRTAVRLLCFLAAEISYVRYFSYVPSDGGLLFVINRIGCDVIVLLGGVIGSMLVMQFAELLERKGRGKLLTLFGKESKSIYLLHMPVLVPLLSAILLRLGIGVFGRMLICTAVGLFVPLLLVDYLRIDKWIRLFVLGEK